MSSADSLLELIALASTSSDELFYPDLQLEPGVHLRWSFRSDLGFPKGGFVVNRVQFGPIANISLPIDGKEALNRLTIATESDSQKELIENRYRNRTTELLSLLNQLQDETEETPSHLRTIQPLDENASKKVRIKILDSILVASIDPFIARMLGLYLFIPPPIKEGLYKVIGDWGDQEWPVTEIDLTNVSASKMQGNILEINDVQITSGRTIQPGSSDEFHKPKFILIGEGEPELPVRIILPCDVAEIILHIETDIAGFAWEAGLDGLKVAGRQKEPESLEWLFKRPDGRRFKRLELFCPDQASYFFKLAFREKSGTIGDISSSEVEVKSSRIEKPIAPVITRLQTTTIPRALSPKGTVLELTSQVEVACHVPATPEDSFRPVRLHVGRSPDGYTGSRPSILLTEISEPATAFPALYQPAIRKPVLPELLAACDLSGTFRNEKSGLEAKPVGRVSFKRNHPRLTGGHSLSLNGTAYIEVTGRPALQYSGIDLTLQAWIRPNGSSSGSQTIIGNNLGESFWIGLDGDNYVQLSLNGRSYRSNSEIPSGQWTRITATYNGEYVRFYLNSGDDAVLEAAIGQIHLNSLNKVCIGADSGSTGGAPLYPFTGEIADVRIWQQALHPDEADDRFNRWFHTLVSQTAISDLVGSWPGIHEFNGRDTVIEVLNRPELQACGTGLTLQAWIKPESISSIGAIITNSNTGGYWFGIIGLSRKLHFRFNGKSFESTASLTQGEWNYVTVIYDGEKVRFYIFNQKTPELTLDSEHAATLGAIRAGVNSKTYIGAAAIIGDVVPDPFKGKLADILIWQRALTLQEAESPLSQTQFIDRGVTNGVHKYQVQGIDLFGRVSDWSKAESIRVKNKYIPTPPVNLRSRYLPLQGTVQRITGRWLITDISIPDAMIDAETKQVAVLVGYDAIVKQTSETPPGVFRENFEIQQARAVANRLHVVLMNPPFNRLKPIAGDRISIAYDLNLECCWGWTGMQRLFEPDTREFRLYMQPGPLNALSGKITPQLIGSDFVSVKRLSRTGSKFRIYTNLDYAGLANELVGMPCQIGNHLYMIEKHGRGKNIWMEVDYQASPVLTPKNGESIIINFPPEFASGKYYHNSNAWTGRRVSVSILHDETYRTENLLRARKIESKDYEGLRNKGVNWLPGSQVYKVNWPDAVIPESLRRVKPEDFVSGALVAENFSTKPSRWQVFNIFWHEWQEPEGLDLYFYFRDPEKTDKEIADEEAKDPLAKHLVLQKIRYYPGKRFSMITENPTEFLPGHATAEWACGVTAVTEAGEESPVTGPVSTYAVDRKRPPVPPKPTIELFNADYYGQSRAIVKWQPLTDNGHIKYQVYRAVDSALFTRDLEQRRLRSGYYRDNSPAEIFADDPDITAWLSARFPGTDLPALFPDKSDKDTWKEKTPIWRAWAERFYPALTLAEVISLAQRRGNESAFTLVNNKPYNKPPDADECVYTDSVKGLVTNRYMYRLRSMSTALLPSSNWSPVSIPKSPPKIKPPRAPVFTKIEAGDRQITLHWALNREPDFREYRLYRAEEKDVLEDLRAWGRDDRLVARIPDPRLKIKRSRLDLPPDLPVADIEAVYFAGEFNRKNKSLIQPRVFNYYKKSAAAPDTPSTFNPDTRRIENLRRIAEGTPVIVIYRDTEDSVQVLEYISTAPPYSDIGLLGLHDYYYRLVTLDWTGNVSEGSKIIHTRTLEIEPPPTPRATAERLVTGGVHRIILRIEVEHGLQVMIQRREVGDVFWTIAAPWQDDSSLTVWSENIEPEADMEYQIWSRTPNKKVCEAPLILRPEIPE